MKNLEESIYNKLIEKEVEEMKYNNLNGGVLYPDPDNELEET